MFTMLVRYNRVASLVLEALLLLDVLRLVSYVPLYSLLFENAMTQDSHIDLRSLDNVRSRIHGVVVWSIAWLR